MTSKYYTPRKTKHQRDHGMTIKEMCAHYDTYNRNIQNWRQQKPDLSFAEWEIYRKQRKNETVSVFDDGNPVNGKESYDS